MFIRSIIVLIFGLLAPLSLSSPLDAQIIYGTILDAESEIGVPDVEVVIIGPDGSSHGQVVTDSLGVFRAVLPLPDHYSLELRHIGYETQVTEDLFVDRGEVITITVSLSQQVLELEPLLIEEERRQRDPRLARFYDRADRNRRAGIGRIYYREDLRRLGSVRTLTSMHRGRGTCTPTVLVDALPIGDIRDLDFLAELDRVEGVEVYQSQHQIPMEFDRSEEHTSELQSRGHIVCRILLEKKMKLL